MYLNAAMDQLRAQGYPVLDADVARLSAYVRKHLNVHGHYSFTPPGPVPGCAPCATSTPLTSIDDRSSPLAARVVSAG